MLSERTDVLFPLQPTLALCPHCHGCVLVCIWHGGTKTTPPRMERLPEAWAPVTGDLHRCDHLVTS